MSDFAADLGYFILTTVAGMNQYLLCQTLLLTDKNNFCHIDKAKFVYKTVRSTAFSADEALYRWQGCKLKIRKEQGSPTGQVVKTTSI